MLVEHGNIIAFDFGTMSIGVAIGQFVTCTAQPLTTFQAQDGTPRWQQIEKLLKEWLPNMVVVGLPLNMDGSDQPLTVRACKFAKRLHGRFGVQVVLHDERLSTVAARAILFERSGYRALDNRQVNASSAAIILESWLEKFSQ